MLGWRWSFIELDTESVFFGQYRSVCLGIEKKSVSVVRMQSMTEYVRIHLGVLCTYWTRTQK